jgi:hypothetical protein
MMAGLAMAVMTALAAHTTPVGTTSGWMWGVTVDNLDEPALIADSLRRLPVKPTTRIVFDESAGPTYYKEALTQIRTAGPIMGEPIDSVLTKKVTVDQYRDRMKWYMEELKGLVDIWEIGNEVNGDWGGDSPSVAAKITAAWQEAEMRQVPSAITLFYSDHYKGTDRDMDAWSKKYLPESVRQGIDYVLVSFYPHQAKGAHPQWGFIFRELAKTFPNAKLGFGELGLANPDYTLNKDVVANRDLIRRYYRMAPPLKDRYIGGYFWWTFRQDAVPHQRKLWGTFAEVMRNR